MNDGAKAAGRGEGVNISGGRTHVDGDIAGRDIIINYNYPAPSGADPPYVQAYQALVIEGKQLLERKVPSVDALERFRVEAGNFVQRAMLFGNLEIPKQENPGSPSDFVSWAAYERGKVDLICRALEKLPH
jgi:hypothetical protein